MNHPILSVTQCASGWVQLSKPWRCLACNAARFYHWVSPDLIRYCQSVIADCSTLPPSLPLRLSRLASHRSSTCVHPDPHGNALPPSPLAGTTPWLLVEVTAHWTSWLLPYWSTAPPSTSVWRSCPWAQPTTSPQLQAYPWWVLLPTGPVVTTPLPNYVVTTSWRSDYIMTMWHQMSLAVD